MAKKEFTVKIQLEIFLLPLLLARARPRLQLGEESLGRRRTRRQPQKRFEQEELLFLAADDRIALIPRQLHLIPPQPPYRNARRRGEETGALHNRRLRQRSQRDLRQIPQGWHRRHPVRVRDLRSPWRGGVMGTGEHGGFGRTFGNIQRLRRGLKVPETDKTLDMMLNEVFHAIVIEKSTIST